MQWFRIAGKLGKTLQEAQQSMTSSEFSGWIEYLDYEQKHGLDRVDVYLAQVAAEVRRGAVSSPGSIHLKDFIIEFGPPKELDPAERLARSKAYWGSVIAKGGYATTDR